ncbi:MAG: protein BatD, partial [Flavobacteriales bacterium]|nr:protein BatD [Flavobacteriales bacterium]
MTHYVKHITLTLIAFLMLSFSYGQNISFTVATSRNTVKTGDRFQIQFTADTKISNFKPPKLSNFRVLSGPNQSTNMSWVNGKTTSSISYSYILMAIKEGEFTIGPAVAFANGKSHKSNSIKIKVTKGVKIQQGGNQNSKTKATQNVSDDMYIRCSVNKTSPYLGEQIIATYKYYTRLRFSGYEQINEPTSDGFWKQTIDLGQSVAKTEIIGGYRWQVYTIKKNVLFPQKVGSLIIDPLEFNFIVQKRVSGGSQNIFDQFFGKVENVEYNVKSKPIKIKVLPLPSNAPSSFRNSVGKLGMKVDVSSNEIKANEAVNIKIKISGKGNLPLIDSPELTFPSDFETYDPKINDNIITDASGVSGSKEFDYLVIPRHAGQFKLDPIV